MTDPRILLRELRQSGDPENPPPEALARILSSTTTIAVVGISRDPVKAARRVPSYLAARGYEVIPVNPHAERILGRRAHRSLDEVSRSVDMVLVFRPSAEAGEVVAQAAGRPERPVIWLQEGIRADQEANAAREAGLTVIQDLCIWKVHRAIGGAFRSGARAHRAR